MVNTTMFNTTIANTTITGNCSNVLTHINVPLVQKIGYMHCDIINSMVDTSSTLGHEPSHFWANMFLLIFLLFLFSKFIIQGQGTMGNFLKYPIIIGAIYVALSLIGAL